MNNRLDLLNEQQRAAVLHTDGPLLILAGAGSGKTRVLTHRAAYLIEEKDVDPYNIMAITFTNKAAGEMRERIDAIVGHGSESIWVSTFHSTCVRILRRHIDRIGFDTNFTIYDADDQKTVMKDICKRLEIDTKMYKERMFLNAISKAKDELITPEEFTLRAAGDFAKQKQAQVYREYQQVLRKNNALDFDDLIVKCVELLQADARVLDYYQERFKYIMVDEYQDTNTAQFFLIKLLADKYQNLCVVGDDDQSIYKFRGANIHNILNFEKYFPSAKVIKLEQNYRSTQNILDAANAVIRNNTGRKAKALWTEQSAGDPLIFKQFESAYDEADYIAGDVRRMKGIYDYRDSAILYRTNAQSRLFEEKFVAANIPYKIVGGVNFYARKEIKDMLAYLKTIDNGKDDLAVKRIINVPKRGIGATSINRVQDYADAYGISFFDALCKAEEIPGMGRAAAKIAPFVGFIQRLRAQADYMSVESLLEQIVEDTGYVHDLELEETEESRARIENIDELLSKAASFDEETENGGLSAFLEEVALIADIDSLDEDSDYVVMMTIHSAKGLEFPNVYLAGMEDGLFPSYMTITSDDPMEIEEERRLCYVGITRAKDRLTLTSARIRMVRGETQFNRVSRFVKEIPDHLMRGVMPKETIKEMPSQQAYATAKKAFNSKPYGGYNTKTGYGNDAVYHAGMGYHSEKSYVNQKQSGVASRYASSGVYGTGKEFATASTAGKTLDYQVGDRVRHMKFGEGEVRQIQAGGRDFEVTVNFDTVGTKKMFASFAKLKKV
ncbi:MAG: DNA helicase PcrA [Eubacterium sp.]|nr:DNA helicase PcrA [Eubacterium sp.]